MLALLAITLALAAVAQGHVCADADVTCALTATLGFCYEPTFRTIACPFTCGYCTCKDGGKPGDCARAKEEGKCNSDPVIKASCMATCGLCACQDRPSMVGCGNFVLHGQCVVNPVANFECPASCKFCGGCEDSMRNCAGRAAAGHCWHADMMAGCKKTCKLCGFACEDATGMEAFCASLKANAQCEVKKNQAYTLCSKTCGHCKEEEEKDDDVTDKPTKKPTEKPTDKPTEKPTEKPTSNPTGDITIP